MRKISVLIYQKIFLWKYVNNLNISNFSEVKSITNFLGRIRKKATNKDFLLFGDFNLPAPGKKDSVRSKKDRAYKLAWNGDKEVEDKNPLTLFVVSVNYTHTCGACIP